MAEPLVLVPDGTGLIVCDLSMFMDALDAGKPLEEALEYAGIDSTTGFTPSSKQLEGLIERVRKYNQTGDIDAFWRSV